MRTIKLAAMFNEAMALWFLIFTSLFLALLIIVFLAYVFNNFREKKRLQAQLDDLMNRFMARDYREYEIAKPTARPVIVREIEAEVETEEEQQEELPDRLPVT